MSWVEGAARRLASMTVSRRRRLAITVAIGIGLVVAQELVLRASGGRGGPWSVAIVFVGTVAFHAVGRVVDGSMRGRYAGRPLDLPHARLIRDAARYYPEVSSWTTPLQPADALARLTERMRVPSVQTRRYDGAVWIRLRQRGTDTSPADAEQIVTVTDETEVMVFVDAVTPAGHTPADLSPSDAHARSVVSIHHGRLRPVIGDISVGAQRRREAAMTEHLILAVRDATGD